MRFLLLFLFPLLSLASVKEVIIKGKVSPETGNFFSTTLFPADFILKVQYDTNSIDQNSDPTIGEYESDGLPMSLDFGGYHFEALNTKVTILSGVSGANWGYKFGNDDEFITSFGFDVAPYGILVQFNTFDPSIAPTDGLDSIHTYEISSDGSTERLYVVDADFYVGNGGNRLLSDSMNGVTSFTVQDIPEPNLLLVGLLTLFIYEKTRNSRSP